MARLNLWHVWINGTVADQLPICTYGTGMDPDPAFLKNVRIRIPRRRVGILHFCQCCGSGSDAFVTPRSGIWDGLNKKIRIRDPDPGRIFWIIFPRAWEKFFRLNIFCCGCGSGSGNLFGPGSGMENIRIRDKHPRSATLMFVSINLQVSLSLWPFWRAIY